ncbi:MAG: DUF4252 domain-containing protein [Rhodothermaceae bacterium]|nr:DUF4252 domain-containing protein [Rhodothermaceae bacterium]
MKSRTLLFTALLFLFSGCTSFELTRVRNDLARQMPEAEIGDGYAMAFGSISMGFARLFAGFADDEDGEIAQVALREVRKVSFGRYDVHGIVDASRLTMPTRLRDYVDDRGWMHLLTFRDTTEAGWVLYRAEDDTITDLFVVFLGAEELTLARVSGNLSALVLNVIESQEWDLPVFQEPETPAEEAEAELLLETATSLDG